MPELSNLVADKNRLIARQNELESIRANAKAKLFVFFDGQGHQVNIKVDNNEVHRTLAITLLDRILQDLKVEIEKYNKAIYHAEKAVEDVFEGGDHD